jgi:hypothetical protein
MYMSTPLLVLARLLSVTSRLGKVTRLMAGIRKDCTYSTNTHDPFRYENNRNGFRLVTIVRVNVQ